MRQQSLQKWTRRAATAATLALAGFGLTCAGASGPTPTGEVAPEPSTREERAREREAAGIHRAARDAFEEADLAAADSLASALVDEYGDTRWLGPALLLSAEVSLELNEPELARTKASSYLRLYRASDPQRAPGLIVVARVLQLEGRTQEAADSLLATSLVPGEDREAAAQLARQVVSAPGLGEIDTLVARWPATCARSPGGRAGACPKHCVGRGRDRTVAADHRCDSASEWAACRLRAHGRRGHQAGDRRVQ
jgi:hypothetical protein